MVATGMGQASQFYLHRDKVEQEIARSMLSFGEKTKLRDACEYALKSGGKRYRPLLVLLIAEALAKGQDVLDAAMSVEFFHTASLVVDDLPCMDNEEERRSSPTVHKIYGESIALLASYSLICAAFEKIHHNAEKVRDARVGMVALAEAARAAGIVGAVGGQFYDLFPPSLSLEALREVIYKKTVTLFEVSFVFGWLFGGGDPALLERVKRAAYHFGMAFQIADDLVDLAQDEKNEREVNLARHIGKERALVVFEEELKALRVLLAVLGLDTLSFRKMVEMLRAHALRGFKSNLPQTL